MASKEVEILRQLLEVRTKSNRAYSIRAFARDLGLSPAFVSQVFAGKRKLSMARAEQIAKALNMDARTSNIFLKAVALKTVSSKSKSENIENLLTEPQATLDYKNLELDQFQFFNHWYHVAILDLTTCTDFKSDTEWIALRLGIAPEIAHSAIDRLLRLGLLRKKNGVLFKTNAHISIPTNNEGSNIVVNFHKQMLDKAKENLNQGAEAEKARRHVSGITMAINSSRLSEAHKKIARFKREMSELLTEGACDEVVQLNIQLFPLSKPLDT